MDYVEIFDAAGSLKGLIMLDSIVDDERFHRFYNQLHFPIAILHCLLVGSDPPSLTVNGDKATIRFLSNDANQKKGFQGHWTTDPGVFSKEHF